MLISRRPEKIQIEVTNRCNLKCHMCPHPDLGAGYKDMDWEVFERVLGRIDKPSEVALTGWGEPLLHPHIFRMISLCKTKGLFATLTTNGVLLDRGTAKRLVGSGIDEVSISVDSFKELPVIDPRHRFPNIEENIRNLIMARQNKKLRIVLQPTLHKGKEGDVLEVIKKAKELGVDMVNVARLDTRFNPALEIPGAKEERKIAREISKLSKKLKIRVDILPFYLLALRIWHLLRKQCPRTYNYLYVTYEGKVTPCCGLPRYIVGDMLVSSLSHIWQAPALKEFRKKQELVCKGCGVLKFPA